MRINKNINRIQKTYEQNLNSYSGSRRRSGDLAMKDPLSHIVVSIHSFVGIGQIEEKLLRIFMRNLKKEKCEGEDIV